jgi:hypothetical protein
MLPMVIMQLHFLYKSFKYCRDFHFYFYQILTALTTWMHILDGWRTIFSPCNDVKRIRIIAVIEFLFFTGVRYNVNYESTLIFLSFFCRLMDAYLNHVLWSVKPRNNKFKEYLSLCMYVLTTVGNSKLYISTKIHLFLQ